MADATAPTSRSSSRRWGAIGIPLLNTIILLTSGVTLTIAHHALKAGHRGALKFWLFITIVLGFTFLGFQAYEYTHAYSELNLKLSTGVYGSTFFMLTGFHGFHVTIGAIMLTVMLARIFRGHFTPHHHFAFEAAAWYWHFVDVVWLLLFILVYWCEGRGRRSAAARGPRGRASFVSTGASAAAPSARSSPASTRRRGKRSGSPTARRGSPAP